MIIKALVENETNCNMKTKHGLSLYIETRNHKILFDLGPDKTLFENAESMNVNLLEVDTVIISHGHKDHGGALAEFLKINNTAKIYVQEKAFEKHYSKVLLINLNISIDSDFKNHPQVVLLDGDFKIDNELRLFTSASVEKCYSNANDTLYEENEQDKFAHEQSLIIDEDKTALIMGCGHTGIVNILEQSKTYNPTLCVGGYHLHSPSTNKTVSDDLLDEISAEMMKYQEIMFYTCHCTGKKAFDYLSNKLPNLKYLSCGDLIDF